MECEEIDETMDEEEEEEVGDWGDWRASDDNEEEEEEDFESDLLCLFCDSKFGSCTALFDHCCSSHRFDFKGMRRTLALDFYGAFKLINYIRSQVAENRCWSCGFSCQSNEDLQNHSHEAVNYKDIGLILDDETYLKPFLWNDPLLYSFEEDEEVDDDNIALVDKEELMRDLRSFEEVCDDSKKTKETVESDSSDCRENKKKVAASTSNGYVSGTSPSEISKVNGIDAKEHLGSYNKELNDKLIEPPFPKIVAKAIKSVDQNYFSSYGSFSIHREMINDKVRTDAYREAILNNPSLLNGASVMDVGCGTGILSLFAAQAGASRVIAIEASEKMATVATQIARDNGLLCSETPNQDPNQCTGVIKVVKGMVEELQKSVQIKHQSIDVLLSEWMGYCLLYESMLSSVLLARDQWLKPGGAILPDTATIFAAGFGRGGTSIPFWENVYGFNMSCIGRAVVEDAARAPVVDVIDSKDLVTDAVILQSFDLANMKLEEMDFTASIEMEPKLDRLTAQCYGVVLWFETGFTSRFCKETPTILSTSPYTLSTHWSQTILTFQEPISLASAESCGDNSAEIGTDDNPAAKIRSRISIARAAEHRAIDISLEATGIGHDGRKRSWPPQIFNLD